MPAFGWDAAGPSLASLVGCYRTQVRRACGHTSPCWLIAARSDAGDARHIKAAHQQVPRSAIPSEETLLAQFRKFYFDTALSTPDGLPSLLAFAAPGHVVFGADNPYISVDVQATFSGNLDGYHGLDAPHLKAINHSNCEALMPRLRSN